MAAALGSSLLGLPLAATGRQAEIILLSSDDNVRALQPQYRSAVPRAPQNEARSLSASFDAAAGDSQQPRALCVSALNYMNTQYTVSMPVNGKAFWVVFDP